MNNTIGVFAFSFVLSCLGTANPKLYAAVSLVFLGFLTYFGNKSFPETIKQLRNKNRTELEDIILKGIESKYFGLRNLTIKNTIFFIGFLFLGGIVILG